MERMERERAGNGVYREIGLRRREREERGAGRNEEKAAV